MAFVLRSTKFVDAVTPAQCRAARALLNITQTQLAESALVGLSTVVDFEKERRQVSSTAVDKICLALERAGIDFLSGNAGDEGVWIRRSLKRGKRQVP